MREVVTTDKFKIIAHEVKDSDAYRLEKMLKDGQWALERNFGVMNTDEDAILAVIEYIKLSYPELYMDQILKLDPDDSQKYPEDTNVKERFAKEDGKEIKFFEVQHKGLKIGEVWNREIGISQWFATYVAREQAKEAFLKYLNDKNEKAKVLPRLDLAVQHLVKTHIDFTEFLRTYTPVKKRGFFASVKRIFKKS